jgi:hypothetical protein
VEFFIKREMSNEKREKEDHEKWKIVVVQGNK